MVTYKEILIWSSDFEQKLYELGWSGTKYLNYWKKSPAKNNTFNKALLQIWRNKNFSRHTKAEEILHDSPTLQYWKVSFYLKEKNNDNKNE